MHEKMVRVNKQRPCPICGRPDWCLVALDGSQAICPRIQQGSIKRCGDAGWLHTPRRVHNVHNEHRHWTLPKKKRPSTLQFDRLSRHYESQLKYAQLRRLSESLHVTARSLERLHVGWDGQAFTFPMSNDFGCVIGLRRRFCNGKKVCVKGSRNGLFVPEGLSKEDFLVILEGESDTCAALDLEFNAIGRAGCGQSISLVCAFCVRWDDVVIVGDNDASGRHGAKRLAHALVLYCRSVKLIFPPTSVNDLRQWLTQGLTPEMFLTAIKQTKVIKPNVKLKLAGGDVYE